MTGLAQQDVVLTICRDEADVIETFVRFYLAQGFDAMHVVDNRSTDDTPERVEGLAREGLPVFLQRDDRLGYERYLTEHYRRVGEMADVRWLFFLDCDEFVLFPSDVKTHLDTLPNEVNCLRLRQKEMYPALNAAEDGDDWDFLLTHRAEPGFNDTTKDVTRFHPEAVVYGGKHRIERPSLRVLTPGDCHIRHYKYRSPRQAKRKEHNRIEAHASYSREDLAHHSAFGLEPTLRWIELCRHNAEHDAWRQSFSSYVAWTEDRELAERVPELMARVPQQAPLNQEGGDVNGHGRLSPPRRT